MASVVETTLRWTSADLAAFPDDGKRYEIIDGELYVSKQPHWHHQNACGNVHFLLKLWNQQSGLGQTVAAPGVIFADDNDVAPDVVWISSERKKHAFGDDGKLHSAPELVVEVVSQGFSNERRDREVKLKLYSRQGVSEYWIVNWWTEKIEVFRRIDADLTLVETLYYNDALESPLLPGFKCSVSDVFSII